MEELGANENGGTRCRPAYLSFFRACFEHGALAAGIGRRFGSRY